MIESLHIKNYALIDDLTVNFKPGLNIFTGSTGAGKTIIIGALSLALGERASEDSIRTGTDETIIEADITNKTDNIEALAAIENPQNLIIRREIKRNGRSRVYLNDRQITLALLKEVGQELADISGQHRQRGLTDSSSHLEIIDRYAGLGKESNDLAESFKCFNQIKSDLNRYQNDRQRIISEKDLLEFQIKEIAAASLTEGEDEELEKEKLQLANAESIKAVCQVCMNILFDDEGSSSERIRTAIKELMRMAKYSQQAEKIGRKLEELSIHLDEAGISIRDLENSFDFDPGRQEIVEDRLALIKKLKRKYGQSIEDILKYHEDARAKLSDFEDLDDTIARLKLELEKSRLELSEKARQISENRKKAASKLEKDVMTHLGDLAMKSAEFKVGFRTEEHKDGPYKVGSKTLSGDQNGYDIIEFLICPNPGEELKPLVTTASGGELSRILLAIISSLVDAFPRDTLVFDEIDSGISGKVASQVGKKLQKLAENRQVICITHLQQIASRGEAHFKVYKGKNRGRTVTKVKFLEGDQRVEEIARLLAGEKISDVAIGGAQKLLEEGRN